MPNSQSQHKRTVEQPHRKLRQQILAQKNRELRPSLQYRLRLRTEAQSETILAWSIGLHRRLFTCTNTVTHPTTNRAQRRVTSLIINKVYSTKSQSQVNSHLTKLLILLSCDACSKIKLPFEQDVCLTHFNARQPTVAGQAIGISTQNKIRKIRTVKLEPAHGVSLFDLSLTTL